MQEIILYAVLALIVGAMLFSVLGKNVGYGGDDEAPEDFSKALGSNLKPEPSKPAFKYEGPGAQGLALIHKADPDFTVAKFLDGAKQAYSMILEAFADGDKDTLQMLLNPEVYKAYEAAIDERAAKGLRQTTDLARLIDAEIVNANRSGKTGRIDVLYDAELATAILNEDGEVVDGDLETLSRVKEVWGYERTLGAKNPNWILCSVEPHETLNGDDDGPDHSPDHPA